MDIFAIRDGAGKLMEVRRTLAGAQRAARLIAASHRGRLVVPEEPAGYLAKVVDPQGGEHAWILRERLKD